MTPTPENHGNPLPEPEHREAWLDGARGLAILLVLCSHYFRFRLDGPVWEVLNAGMRAGWVGVDLFFVLSGFLITGILVRARGGEHFFRNFYARRTLRIFPAYYLYLAVVFLLVVPLDARVRATGIGDWAPSHLLHVQNLAMVPSTGLGAVVRRATPVVACDRGAVLLALAVAGVLGATALARQRLPCSCGCGVEREAGLRILWRVAARSFSAHIVPRGRSGGGWLRSSSPDVRAALLYRQEWYWLP